MNSVRRRSQHQVPPQVVHQSNDVPYYEHDYGHYYGSLASHNDFDSHYHASSSFYPHQSFYLSPSSHHPYPPRSIRYAAEQDPRKKSKKRPRHHHGTNYNTDFGDKTTQQSNSNNNLHQQQYQHNDSTEGEDDDFLTPLEAEALRNAELNKTVHTATATDSIHETTDTMTTVPASSNPQLETSATEQQQSATSTGKPFSKKKHDKAFGVLLSFFRRFASTTTPHQQKKKKHSVLQTKGNIQTMWVSTPLGDVMDQQQQQEVIQMLRQQTDAHHTPSGQPTPHDDATKVASLDHIWVFRCIDTINNDHHDSTTTTSTIWTGFDYENQVKLSQHSKDENGIELYDTHIRNGLFPILVLPKRQICFYAAGGVSDQVSSLQVACLPNSKNVQFVYRCGMSSSS